MAGYIDWPNVDLLEETAFLPINCVHARRNWPGADLLNSYWMYAPHEQARRPPAPSRARLTIRRGRVVGIGRNHTKAVTVTVDRGRTTQCLR